MASKKAPNDKRASKSSAGTRREALRQAQLEAAAHQKRLRTIIIVIAAVVAAAIIALVALGATGVLGGSKSSSSTPTGEQIVPPNATSGKTGILSTISTNQSAPLLVSVEDFQCPVCKTYETVYRPVFESLAKKGKIRMEYRMRYFLDDNLRNDSSVRAARAAACADTVGKFQQYHDTVYNNQPSTEGQGYTDQQLRVTFPQQAGISGSDLTTFQSCYDQSKTASFVKTVDTNAANAGYDSTPTFVVNGKTIQFTEQNPTEDYVMSVINAAA